MGLGRTRTESHTRPPHKLTCLPRFSITSRTGRWICDDAGGRCYLLHATLNKLAAKLDPKAFLRVHRSAIVSLNAIKEITPGIQDEFDIVLHYGTALLTGRTYGEVMRQLLSHSL